MMRDNTKREVLKIMTEPRTTQELADILGCHYQTAYRYIRELMKDGDVIDLPLPKANGQLVYVKDSASVDDGAIRVQFKDSLMDLPSLIQRISSADGLNHSAAAILAQVFCRSWFGQSDDALINRYAGIMSNLEHKGYLRSVALNARALAKTIEQLLDVEELWTDTPKSAALFGPVDPEAMRQAAETWLTESHKIKTGGR